MVHIQLVRSFEKNAAFGASALPSGDSVAQAAYCAASCERFGVLGFGRPASEPRVSAKLSSVSGSMQQRLEFGGDRKAVDRGGFFGRLAGERLALDETAVFTE